MTRKDYRIIAAAIKASRLEMIRQQQGPAAQQALAFLSGYLGASLRIDNPRFDFDKFVDAAQAEGQK